MVEIEVEEEVSIDGDEFLVDEDQAGFSSGDEPYDPALEVELLNQGDFSAPKQSPRPFSVPSVPSIGYPVALETIDPVVLSSMGLSISQTGVFELADLSKARSFLADTGPADDGPSQARLVQSPVHKKSKKVESPCGTPPYMVETLACQRSPPALSSGAQKLGNVSTSQGLPQSTGTITGGSNLAGSLSLPTVVKTGLTQSTGTITGGNNLAGSLPLPMVVYTGLPRSTGTITGGSNLAGSLPLPMVVKLVLLRPHRR